MTRSEQIMPTIWAGRVGRYLRYASARAATPSEPSRSVSGVSGIAIAVFLLAWFAAHLISAAGQL